MSEPQPTLVICPHCGQPNAAHAAQCAFCGTEITPANTSPAPPASPYTLPLPYIGYGLGIAFGGLVLLAGLVFAVYAWVTGITVGGVGMVLATWLVGLALIWQCLLALISKKRPAVRLGPAWFWLLVLVFTWGIGSLVNWQFPRLSDWVLPPLVVLTSLAAALLFGALTVRGLRTPANRAVLDQAPAPRHSVYLTGIMSAIFSTGGALILEGIALVVVAMAMLVGAKLLGDESTFRILISMASDADPLATMEGLMSTSPILLVGLIAIMGISAPLIEEPLKALPAPLVGWQRIKNNPYAERTMILLGVAGGLGFAFAENIGYLSMTPEDWSLLVWFRTCAAIMHGLASGFAGRAWFRALNERRWLAALGDMALSVGLHGTWNILAILIGWFGGEGVIEGIMLGLAVGMVPIVGLFVLIAWRGMWVKSS